MTETMTRRMLVKSSAFGLISLAFTDTTSAAKHLQKFSKLPASTPRDRYPAISLDLAMETVGLSHFNLEGVKKLVDLRPELARASWDWGFGDWESAMDAATHTGHKDIVDYLFSKGALPTLFTQAMLGKYQIVKSSIEALPGIEKSLGPHGLSLVDHVKTGLDAEGTDKEGCKKLLDLLLQLGGADGKKYLAVAEQEKQKYLGDYKYGEGKDDGFTISLNMRKNLSLGLLGKKGGSLLRLTEEEFTYNGAPSVIIRFTSEKGHISALTITEPGFSITARKI